MYLATVHAYWQNSSTKRRMWWYKLPIRARWCRTGHKKLNTLLQNKKKKPEQPWSTFRYRTPVRAFKKIFTDKGVDASGWQRSSEGVCPKAPSSSVMDGLKAHSNQRKPHHWLHWPWVRPPEFQHSTLLIVWKTEPKGHLKHHPTPCYLTSVVKAWQV